MVEKPHANRRTLHRVELLRQIEVTRGPNFRCSTRTVVDRQGHRKLGEDLAGGGIFNAEVELAVRFVFKPANAFDNMSNACIWRQKTSVGFNRIEVEVGRKTTSGIDLTRLNHRHIPSLQTFQNLLLKGIDGIAGIGIQAAFPHRLIVLNPHTGPMVHGPEEPNSGKRDDRYLRTPCVDEVAQPWAIFLTPTAGFPSHDLLGNRQVGNTAATVRFETSRQSPCSWCQPDSTKQWRTEE